MFKRKEAKPQNSIVPVKDTLIIVGNGFDIWQNLPTDYSRFETYYYEHLDDILKKLRIKKKKVYGKDMKPALDESGNPIAFSDVELLYGDPFDPDTRLSHGFWHRFEDSLDKLDAQGLNAYFGKEDDELEEMRQCARNANRILRQAFCDWVASINIDDRDAKYQFGDNCLFINFNYTDTLVKRFHIKKINEFHIHGEAADPESIIFGHATHPEYPFQGLYRLGGRLRGLYFIEDILYNTDKHVEDNIGALHIFLAMHGVQPGQIKKIYVLGHALGASDVDYFRHIVNTTQGLVEDPEAGLSKQERSYLDHMDPMEKFHMNIQYAVHQGYRSMGIIPDAYPPIIKGDEESERQLRLEAAVVHRRFLAEQYARDLQLNKAFLKMLRRARRRGGKLPRLRAPKDEKTELPTKDSYPQWHFSYHSDEDKIRIETAMQKLNCQNFALHPTIDECLAPFEA